MLRKLIEKSDEKFNIYESDSTGTDGYYQISIFVKNIVATSGVIKMFEDLESFWIGDIVASYVPDIVKLNETFVSVRVVKELTGNSAIFLIEDGDYDVLITQEISYTDLKTNIKLFMQFDGDNYVLMQPSEY